MQVHLAQTIIIWIVQITIVFIEQGVVSSHHYSNIILEFEKSSKMIEVNPEDIFGIIRIFYFVYLKAI